MLRFLRSSTAAAVAADDLRLDRSDPVNAARHAVGDSAAPRTVDTCAECGYFHQQYAYETFTSGPDLPMRP
ncbi:hypothetical protein [Chitinasiproducens palmae]|uniref:Uncharacterized protein n=1 Tax=Chitinasiproducens palmae TaxID=1770053 RepID=A0A1H2PJM4_9BURK|nr:hypothetical protein [Chitinasiproducens palmae]SDV46472.1 hypothetical protein SAMN05216551_101363 [Chitinasiproducens palmae]